MLFSIVDNVYLVNVVVYNFLYMFLKLFLILTIFFFIFSFFIFRRDV